MHSGDYMTQDPSVSYSLGKELEDFLDLLVEIALARIEVEDFPITTPQEGEDET